MRIAGAGIASAPRSSSISTSSPACSSERVTTMRRPKSGRSSNQRRCSRSPATAPTTSKRRRSCRAPARRSSPSVPSIGLLRRQRAVVDQRRRFLRRAAVRQQRVGDGADLPRAGIAHQRAAEPGEPRPVHVRRLVDFAFVPAHERQHVARAGIGDRHAGVGGAADRGRDPGHDLERNPCSCRNSASLPPLSKTNGSPHFRRTTVLSFARLLGEQLARWHPGRAASAPRIRRRCFSAPALRKPQQPRVHAMVVDDDVRRLEVAPAADADERRIARPGADDVDAGCLHALIVTTRSRRPRARVRSARRRPSSPGRRGVPRAARRIASRAVGRWSTIACISSSPAVVHGDRAERQLAAAAERRDERPFGVERDGRRRRHDRAPASGALRSSSALISVATIP